jgi:integrase
MNIRQEIQNSETKRKRSAPRYWVEIKGKLYARLQYKAESGKYQVKYKPISDKRTAKRVAEEMRKELETHSEKTLLSDKMTFLELAEKYEQIKLVPATYQNGVKISGKRSIAPVKSALNPLLAYFGQKAIRSIKTSDIESYKTQRLNTPVEREINVKIETRDENDKIICVRQKKKKSTPRKLAGINRELALLRVILNFAVQNEWLIKNPFILAKGVISMSAEVERDRVLSFKEETRLLSVCNGARVHLKPLLICALDTGMRRGEMFKMRWQDVDFGKNEIFIPQTNTKTEDSRTIGMTPRLKEELELLWEVSPKDKTGLVFGITNTIKTAWKTACRLANIEDFRFHDCRHTATTRMITSGSPHTEVMKITGHSQLKTFLRYLNITSETANNVALRLNDYLSKRQFQTSEISTAVN